MTPGKAVNHIGIAVRSIDSQRPVDEGVLGAELEGVEQVADQKVRVGFFRVGDVRLELLEPTDPTSMVAVFSQKRGEGLHHLAFTVAGIEDPLAELKRSGVRLIDDAPRPGAHHLRIAFLYPWSRWRAPRRLTRRISWRKSRDDACHRPGPGRSSPPRWRGGFARKLATGDGGSSRR